jgi:hypothetical protein
MRASSTPLPTLTPSPPNHAPPGFKASSLPDWAGLGKTAVKAKGSSGVAEAITATPGSIGYLEISNKLAAKLTPASVRPKPSRRRRGGGCGYLGALQVHA